MTQPQSKKRGKWTRRARRALALFFIAALLIAGYLWWTAPQPMPPTLIFQGVTYRCQKLPDTAESGGLMQLIEVDLNAPGIELFVTPIDPQAKAVGGQYYTQYVGAAARKANLSVAVNGTLFGGKSSWRQWPGQLTMSGETIVADGQVNHVYPHSYLLWFDDNLVPRLEKNKPPPQAALVKARWAISGQEVLVSNGKVRGGTGTHPDRRTMIGIDTQAKKLFIAVFDHASYRIAGEMLVQAGAKDATTLDGGSSTAMYIGPGAVGVPTGTVSRNWIPVGPIIGLRAKPIEQ